MNHLYGMGHTTQTFSLFFEHEKKKIIHILVDMIPKGFINTAWEYIRFKAQSIRYLVKSYQRKREIGMEKKSKKKLKCNILLFYSLFIVHVHIIWHQRIQSAGLHINDWNYATINKMKTIGQKQKTRYAKVCMALNEKRVLLDPFMFLNRLSECQNEIFYWFVFILKMCCIQYCSHIKIL